MYLHNGLPINNIDDRVRLNDLPFSTQEFIMDITWCTIRQLTFFFLCHTSNTDLTPFGMFFISLSIFKEISFTWAAVHNIYIAIQAIGNTKLVNLHKIIRQKVFVFTQITFLSLILFPFVFYSNIKCFRITNFRTPFNYIISYGINRHTLHLSMYIT